jgi:SAM-dependent methyltransferase
MKAFMAGKSSLNQIELDLLGDVSGKRILHLQCHFGQDSLSLSRMGAKVTAVDFSEKSIQKAKEIAKELEIDIKFVCSDIYDLPNNLSGEFDIVFTSYGTVIWLPDTQKWANVIEHFLAPKGQFVFVDFHPVIWMFDDDLKEVIYKYSSSEAIVEDEEGTYADRNADVLLRSVTWNHGIGQTVNSLISAGLQLNDLQEYDYAPYPFIGHTEEFEPGKFRIKHFKNNLPLVYSLVAQNV